MVIGLDRLRSYFEKYNDKYIIIGGTACEQRLETRGVDFRATKDVDMILVIENLDKEFTKQFWQFITDGEYTNRFVREEQSNFFRFSNPAANDFPQIVELFSRKADGIDLPDGYHLTPIPTDEEISSLSAMLLDDDYYEFTLKNCSDVDGLMVANEHALICLKTKAYINNRQREIDGQIVRNEDIEKHKKDVLKLILTLESNGHTECPESIKTDLRKYLEILKEENTDIAKITIGMKLGRVSLEEIKEILNLTFSL